MAVVKVAKQTTPSLSAVSVGGGSSLAVVLSCTLSLCMVGVGYCVELGSSTNKMSALSIALNGSTESEDDG